MEVFSRPHLVRESCSCRFTHHHQDHVPPQESSSLFDKTAGDPPNESVCSGKETQAKAAAAVAEESRVWVENP